MKLHSKKRVNSKFIHLIQKMIDVDQTDRYVKKLFFLPFFKAFIYALLKGVACLGRISDKVSRKKMVQRLIGLESISKSQLSRKFSTLPPEMFQVILHHLVQKLHQKLGPKQAEKALGKIHLIDSSTISMCLGQYEWAEFRHTKSGVKLHTSINFCGGISYPNEVITTPARPADVTQLDTLIIDKNALHVFDRGYFDFFKFENYCANGIRFATRIKVNTVLHVIEELPIDPSSAITRDAIVKIGAIKYPLHLVETLDSEGNKISIVCNDANVNAQEISDLYRTRWQIEWFFKWIKQHLVLKRLYGKSENAVFNQINIAMITFCLNLLMKTALGYKGTLLEMFHWVSDFWSEGLPELTKELFKKPDRTTNGRRKIDHQQIYEETLFQYQLGGVSHLDDLIYDPII